MTVQDSYTISNQIQGPFANASDTTPVAAPVAGVTYFWKWTVKSSGVQPYSVLYDFSDDANWYWIGGAQQNYKTSDNNTVVFSRSFAVGTYTVRMHVYNVLIANGGVYYV
jgi:PKD repeat protein